MLDFSVAARTSSPASSYAQSCRSVAAKRRVPFTKEEQTQPCSMPMRNTLEAEVQLLRCECTCADVGLYWYCTGSALVLHWHCSATVLVLYCYCVGVVVVLHRHCPANCDCTASVLVCMPHPVVLHRHRTGAAPVLHWHCLAIVLLLHCCCTGVYVVLLWREGSGTVLVLSLRTAAAVRVQNPHWCCIGTALLLHWYSAFAVSVLGWYCAGTGLLLDCYCTVIVLFLCLY